MGLRPITVYGDSILRKKTRRVTDINDDIITLIKDMFDTMRNANGIGLAANQVGSDKSVIVIDVSPIEGLEDVKPMVLINPKIVNRSEETEIAEEGCLSLPNLRADVERPEKIVITYYDTQMVEHEIEAEKLLARVMQHEYDHLNGVLLTDRLPEDERKRFNQALTKIKNRDIEVDYPVTRKQTAVQ
jgi:peptide deformylase